MVRESELDTLVWSNVISLNHLLFKNMAYVGSFEHFVFVFVYVFLCVFVFVIVIPGDLWILCVISFQKIYGLIGWQCSCDDL